jgi:hypothetical protein
MAGKFWTKARDKRLQRLEAAGLSAAQIAERIGATRNAVIGRSVRLRGLVFQSQVLKARKRKAARDARNREQKQRADAVLSKLRRAMAHGTSREDAIAKAVKSGITYQAIGDELGVSRQRVHQIVCRR